MTSAKYILALNTLYLLYISNLTNIFVVCTTCIIYSSKVCIAVQILYKPIYVYLLSRSIYERVPLAFLIARYVADYGSVIADAFT